MYIPCDLRNFDIVETKDGNLLVYVKEAGYSLFESVLVHITGREAGQSTTYDRMEEPRPVGMFMMSHPLIYTPPRTNIVARVWRAKYAGDVVRLIKDSGYFDNFKANALITYQNPSASAPAQKPAPRKMTVGEIAAKLGYDVEVVKG